MLYVTTRNDQDPVTVCHVLQENRGEDGGLFLPLHLPKFSVEELEKLTKAPFNQRIAEILNLFFSTRLTAWDVDFAIGRYPVRLEYLSHRIYMAECWHNPQWHYDRMANNLLELLSCEGSAAGSWGLIAIRMAVLAGILCELDGIGNGIIDVSVVSGDFNAPISVWYLRQMGFPIGNIVCCCNENNQIWELICQGQMRTDGTCVSTLVPEADVVYPVDLERLLYTCGGVSEVMRYLECSGMGTSYAVPETLLQKMRQGFYVSVVSSNRVETVIPNVYKSHEYLMAPASALSYSGLLDYRTKTGITRHAVALCDKSPACQLGAVARAMQISETELKRLI